MSKHNQKVYTAEDKRKAIEQYSEKIQYSPRYSGESAITSKPRSSTWSLGSGCGFS